MIVSNIMMGLGNQMFQYAAGRSLSLHLKVPLKLYTHSYSRYHLRKYELENYFEMTPEIAAAQDLQLFNLSHPVRDGWNYFFPNNRIRGLPYEEKQSVKLLYEIFYLFKPPHTRNVYEERKASFDSNFFKAKSPIFLKGYWMSYKYFQHCEDIIKKDFTIRPELIAHLSGICTEIQTTESIAIHVRCTDRKTPENISQYGEIPYKYYERGIEYIQQHRGKNVHLYVFSDDEKMARKYIPNNLPVHFISNLITKDPIEDFYLMTQCKNLIITNSSFSWWAAYLTKSENPIIIAPLKWANNNMYNYEDIHYPGWVKIKNSKN